MMQHVFSCRLVHSSLALACSKFSTQGLLGWESLEHPTYPMVTLDYVFRVPACGMLALHTV